MLSGVLSFNIFFWSKSTADLKTETWQMKALLMNTSSYQKPTGIGLKVSCLHCWHIVPEYCTGRLLCVVIILARRVQSENSAFIFVNIRSFSDLALLEVQTSTISHFNIFSSILPIHFNSQHQRFMACIHSIALFMQPRSRRPTPWSCLATRRSTAATEVFMFCSNIFPRTRLLFPPVISLQRCYVAGVALGNIIPL